LSLFKLCQKHKISSAINDYQLDKQFDQIKWQFHQKLKAFDVQNYSIEAKEDVEWDFLGQMQKAMSATFTSVLNGEIELKELKIN